MERLLLKVNFIQEAFEKWLKNIMKKLNTFKNSDSL